MEPKPPRATFNYKIVACRNAKQFKYIGRFTSSDDAYAKIEELLKESEKVIIPSVMSHRNKVCDVVCAFLGNNDCLRGAWTICLDKAN